MSSAIENVDLEHELVQLVAKEGMKVAMGSPLRDPILEAVEETTGEPVEAAAEDRVEDEAADANGNGRRPTAVRGLLGFVALFAALYVVFRRLTGGDAN